LREGDVAERSCAGKIPRREAGRQFDFALCGGPRRPESMAEMHCFCDKVEPDVRALLAVTSQLPKTRREHHAIFKACAAKDAERAATLTRARVLDSGSFPVKYLSDLRAEPRTTAA
jgi:DNA-binding GntR family transcriptional regulator